MNLADWVGVAGFFIALALAILRVWELFLREPKYEVNFTWVHGGAAAGRHLEFTIANVGHAAGVVTSILFQPNSREKDVGQSGLMPNSVSAILPVQLGIGETTPIIKLGVGESRHYEDGTGRVLLIGTRKLNVTYAIPRDVVENPEP